MKPQVFSCCSRRLNHHNAFSLPEMMNLCTASYVKRGVLEHVVVSNILNFEPWLSELCIPKTQFRSGIQTVSLVFVEHIEYAADVYFLEFVFQIHEFRIAREETPPGSEVRAPSSRSGQEHWVMLPVATRTKYNSQCPDLSEPLYLVHSLPGQDSLPGSTGKHHLFMRKTAKGKPCVQTPGDLSSKMDGLKKTVAQIRAWATFTAVDGDWWTKFFAEHEDMAEEQHGLVEAPADPLILARVTSLFWSTTGHVHVGHVTVPVPRAAAVVDAAVGKLRLKITPTYDKVNPVNFSRKRAVGYYTVLDGENPDDAMERAVAVNATNKQSFISKFCEEIGKSRGTSENDLLNKIEVTLNSLHC